VRCDVRSIWEENIQVYGARKVCRELNSNDYQVTPFYETNHSNDFCVGTALDDFLCHIVALIAAAGGHEQSDRYL
jgi:hypothetical protein